MDKEKVLCNKGVIEDIELSLGCQDKIIIGNT